AVVNVNDSLQAAVRVAQALAREYHQACYAPAHLLRGLLHEPGGLQPFVSALGKEVDYTLEWAEVRMESLEKDGRLPELITANAATQRVLQEADLVRIKLGLELITPICALVAICKPTTGFYEAELARVAY